MRRRARPESVEQEAELFIDLLVREAQYPEHAPLQRGIVDPDAPRTELSPVVHQIVRSSAHGERIGLEEVHVVRVRHDERMVGGVDLAVRLLEDREVRDPEPGVLPFERELQGTSHRVARRRQRR